MLYRKEKETIKAVEDVRKERLAMKKEKTKRGGGDEDDPLEDDEFPEDVIEYGKKGRQNIFDKVSTMWKWRWKKEKRGLLC